MLTTRSNSHFPFVFIQLVALFAFLLPPVFATTYPTTPYIYPQGGTYTTGKTITITDGTAGSVIHYTTDGSTPTAKSPILSGTISIPTQPMTKTIQAIAVTSVGWSSVATTKYVISPVEPKPSFSVIGGTYTSTQKVTLSSSASGSTIHYTTDGSTPTVNSHAYSSPINVTNSMTVAAMVAGPSGYSSSPVVTETYTLTTAKPVATPASGTYSPWTETVTFTDATPGATIYYTTDGSQPTTSSTKYTGPFTLGQNTNMYVMAAAPGFNNSAAIHSWFQFYTPTPAVTPAPGSYTTAQVFSVTNTYTADWVYYTTDGSTPTTSSILYKGPVPLSKTGSWDFKVLAVKGAHQPSHITETAVSLSLPSGAIANAAPVSSWTHSIATDYLGLAHEWNSAQTMMGSSAVGVNVAYRTLLSHLINNMKGPLVLRIGDGTTDRSGTVTAATVEPLGELAQAMNVRYLLGVNLGSNNLSLSESQAKVFMTGSTGPYVDALEIGNEPDLFANKYRPSTYSFTDYQPQFMQWSSGISATNPLPVSFAGPALGSSSWEPAVQSAITAGTYKADIYTHHEYVACYYASNPLPTDILLQPTSSSIGGWFLKPYSAAAHAAGSKLRVGEMNSVCRGGQFGVSDTFSSALWAIDTMFQYSSYGVDGINMNTDYSGGAYDLFKFKIVTWNGVITYTLEQVRPIYYGMLFFSRAAGNSAKLLNTSTLSNFNIKVWMTTDQSGKGHIVVINKEPSQSGTVEVVMPGYSKGTVTRLTASSYTATSGVTFGGQTFDGTVDGSILGSLQTEAVTPSNGVWKISMQPASAALVDLQ